MTKIFDRFLKEPSDVSCGCDDTCCGSRQGPIDDESAERLKDHPWTTGRMNTSAGDVPIVATRWSTADRLGTLRMRLGIGRTIYTIPPGLYGVKGRAFGSPLARGLYPRASTAEVDPRAKPGAPAAVGHPNAQSPVYVTANYKMSFDRVRQALDGLDGWILVLDTRGINVWCAAGKGTFGTDELVRRIESSGLAGVVSHRKLILPQLGAPGVAAHEITKRTKFHVVYGPVRAEDIPEFMRVGMKTTPAMRKVRFSLKDRLILTPVELSGIARHWAFLLFLGLWILRLLGVRLLAVDFPAVLAAVVVGAVLVPILLPWIPGRAFAWKGWLLGIVLAVVICAIKGLPATTSGWAATLSYFLVLPAISGFLAMNFTGSSPITSLSGVVKEMRTAVPLIALSAVLGVAAMIVSAVLKA